MTHKATASGIDGVSIGKGTITFKQLDEGGDSKDSKHFADDITIMGNIFIGQYCNDEDNQDQEEVDMIPFIFKELIIAIANYPKQYVDQEYHLEDVVNNIELLAVGG